MAGASSVQSGGGTSGGGSGSGGSMTTAGNGSGGSISASGSGGMISNIAGMSAGSGGMSASGSGGAGTGMIEDPGDGGMVQGGTTGAAGSTPPSEGGCTPPPAGTFDVTTESGGPDGNYTIVRPTTLGEGGFLHPPVAWGNGLGTVPSAYVELLENVASNGFVVIANPGTGSDPQVVRAGLDWLIEQNEGSGTFAGKLAVDCAGNIGYSMGGGAAADSAMAPVKAVVAIHGIPGSRSGTAAGPILLITSTGDTFVTISGFVMPVYNAAADTNPVFMAIHEPQEQVVGFGDHIHPLGSGGIDTEPAIAWLRLWLYGDTSQKDWFYGANCKLCGQAPWLDPNKKNHAWE